MVEEDRILYRCKFIRLVHPAIRVSGDISIETGKENLRRINSHIDQKIFLEKEKEKERIGNEIFSYSQIIQKLVSGGMDATSIKNIIDFYKRELTLV